MDVGGMAAQAIGVVATYLGAVASGVARRAEDLVGHQLFRLISDRLRSTKIGATALQALEEQPDSPTRRQMATAALKEAATADEQFAVQLRNELSSVEQGQAVGSVVRGQANVSAGGNISLSRSEIAGSIDKSRRSIRIGVGGLVLAGVVLLGGITAGVVIWNDNDSDEPPDPRTIGRTRDEAGVREAANGFLDAIAARDVDRVCAFIEPADASNMLVVGGCAAVVQQVVFDRVPPDMVNRMADVEVVSVDLLTPDNAPSFGSAQVETSEEVVGLDRDNFGLHYETGRWLVEWSD